MEERELLLTRYRALIGAHEALGIPNSSISASSFAHKRYDYKTKVRYCPGRLFDENRGWRPSAEELRAHAQPWIQFDFGETKDICAVRIFQINIRTYRITFSMDGSSWYSSTLMETLMEVQNELVHLKEFRARFVRFQPVEVISEFMTLNMELYTSQAADQESPLQPEKPAGGAGKVSPKIIAAIGQKQDEAAPLSKDALQDLAQSLRESLERQISEVQERIVCTIQEKHREACEKVLAVEQQCSNIKQEADTALQGCHRDIVNLGDSLSNLTKHHNVQQENMAQDILKLKEALGSLTTQQVDHQENMKGLRDDLDRLDRKSAFFTIYKTVPPPADKEEIFEALNQMLRVYTDDNYYSESRRDNFLANLRRTVDSDPKPANMSEVQWTGVRLWTSEDVFRGPEKSLCSIIAEMNFTDNTRMMSTGGITVQKALNEALVTRGASASKFPSTGQSYRGTGIPASELSFWTSGKKYRAAAPLATSFDELVSQRFLKNVDYKALPKREPVQFIFEWQVDEKGDYSCEHAFYVDNVSAVKGEKEIVLAGFSVFEVAGVSFQEHATESAPHVIVLKVMADNWLHPEYLPVAKWH